MMTSTGCNDSRQILLAPPVRVEGCTHLVLPLARHNLAVGSRDVHAGVKAGLVVRLHNVPPEGILEADGAVVRAL